MSSDSCGPAKQTWPALYSPLIKTRVGELEERLKWLGQYLESVEEEDKMWQGTWKDPNQESGQEEEGS